MPGALDVLVEIQFSANDAVLKDINLKIKAHDFYDIKWTDDWIKTNSGNYYVYNYPLLFDWMTNDGYGLPVAKTHKNLFELHKIDDPTQNNIQNKTWETTMELCCETLDLLIDYKGMQDGLMAHLDYLVKLSPTENGSIKKLEIDYDKSEIRISGEINTLN